MICQHRFLDLVDAAQCVLEEHPDNPGGHSYTSPGCPLVDDKHDASEAAAERTRG